MDKFLSELRMLFSSISLAIVLLGALALASVLGTLVPQHEAAREFLQGRPPWVVTAFQLLHLHDIFRSPWYIGLLGLLTVNMIVCSWHRLPGAWSRFRSTAIPGEKDIFLETEPEWEYLSSSAPAAEKARMERLMRKRFRRVRVTESQDEVILGGQKGSLSYLGPHIVHAGVIVMILGGLIGSFFGFRAFVNILEGESIQTVRLLRGQGIMALGFSVRCDNFSVEFYETGQPKMYRSDLTFYRGDKILKQAALMVNYPVQVEGILFYQASYGAIADRAHVRILEGQRELKTVDLSNNGRADLPGEGSYVRVLRLESNMMELGPAAKLEVRVGDRFDRLWIFQNIEEIEKAHPGFLKVAPIFDPGRMAPYRFELADMDEIFYTGLQLNRDPGVPLVGAGALLMVLGLIATYFYPHRQFFIRLRPDPAGTIVTLAGKTNRDPAVLTGEMRKLWEFLKTG